MDAVSRGRESMHVVVAKECDLDEFISFCFEGFMNDYGIAADLNGDIMPF
jgi:hypothetical protein